MSEQFSLSRRQFFGGTAATTAALFLGSVPAQAKGPFLTNQPAPFYRFKLGAFECTVVSDGPLPLGKPTGSFLGASEEELNKMLTDNFLSTEDAVLEQNNLIVNTGSKLVLFDTGMGYFQTFGPTTGRMLKSMKAAGINPKDIDAICITHGHIDHLGGLVGKDGKQHFPNAQVFINEADFNFWTDKSKVPAQNPGFMKDFIEAGRHNLLPERDKIVFVKDQMEVVPGVQAVAAPGHTLGHTVYIIASQGQSLCDIGDLLHHQVILMEQPKLKTKFDTDPTMAGETRARILGMLAEQRIPLLGYHFPWPGYGHAVKFGDGFRYLPAPMDLSKVG